MSRSATGRLALLALTPLVPLLAFVPGGRWLAPLAAPLVLWPSFAGAVRAGRLAAAFGSAMLWALLLSVVTIALTRERPEVAAAGIWNAEPYRQAMFGWIETGVGRESDPRGFLPEHALHLAAFALLALSSGGYLGLALGAALLGYMNYFVGAFSTAAGAPLAGSLAAWVPWAVVRVTAFVALGTALARPLLAGGFGALGGRERRWIGAALLGVLLDVTLKATLAPSYGLWLRDWLPPR